MIVKMSKITLLGMEEQRKALINSLMELGAVEIRAIGEKEYEDVAQHPVVQDELSSIEGSIADVNAALESLNKYCPEKKGLFQSRREITISEFDKIVDNKDRIRETIKQVKEQEEYLIQLKAEENRLNNIYSSLLPWGKLLSPLHISGTQKTGFQLGTIPSVIDCELIETELYETAPYSKIDRIHSDKDQHYVYVLFHKDMEQECSSYLKSRGFNRAAFPGLSGTVPENLEILRKRLKELSVEREYTIEQIKSLKDTRKSIEVLYDAIGMEQGRIMAAGKVLKTKKAFLIKGWIPEKLAVYAKEWLETQYTVSVEVTEPEEDEEFPVLLENKGMAEAAEPVTTMYSLPNSREIDPNTVLAPFFILFFGLMLSDGGYGIIMALLAGFFLKRFKLEAGNRKFMKLMFYCGISTIFWGAMFGGWFGIEAFVPYAAWFNMVEDPELMLSWSLLFGVIHMFVGLGVRAANLLRRKKYLDALFDAGFWYIFFTGFVLYLLPFVPKVDKVKVAPLVNIGQYILIIGAVLLILTQGRHKKNIIGKFFGGISRLYDLIGFMSDVLSYSRLMALGLATSIIASIVNQMSVMFDFPIVLKIIFALGILIVGHAINFAINALGAYVHSCRLQYLEFFGKFFAGGGVAFNPLKANTKYIIIKPNAGM